jgi:hypothetical protein
LARPTLEHWKAVERQAYIKEKKSHHLVYRKPRELRVIGRDANSRDQPRRPKEYILGAFISLRTITSWSSKKLKFCSHLALPNGNDFQRRRAYEGDEILANVVED